MLRNLNRKIIALILACGLLGFAGGWSAEAGAGLSAQLAAGKHQHHDDHSHYCPAFKPPHHCIHSTALALIEAEVVVSRWGPAPEITRLSVLRGEPVRFEHCFLRGPPLTV